MAASTSGFRPGRKQSLVTMMGGNSNSNQAGTNGPPSSSSSYSQSNYEPSMNGSIYSNSTSTTVNGSINNNINFGSNNNSTGSLASSSGHAASSSRTPTLSMTSTLNNNPSTTPSTSNPNSNPNSVNGGIGAPVAANSMANKPAVAASSLYQACLGLRNRLYRVPNFGEEWLSEEAMISHGATTSNSTTSSSSSSTIDPTTSSAPSSPKNSTNAPTSTGNGIIGSDDPVTSIWAIARLGAPLCSLYNHLNLTDQKPLDMKLLEINPNVNHQTMNDCKKHVAKFIMAITNVLKWEPDDVFTVSNVYSSDTNGFVKIVKAMHRILDVLESKGLLLESSETLDDLHATLQPGDDRARVVRELLDTERKYVQDLEVMQNYAKALAMHDILPVDTIHSLFGNLNTLVDVQRRFLISVEDNARRDRDGQHFGMVFMAMESDFSAYEPFCANYAQALGIIEAEMHNLKTLEGLPGTQGCFLDPKYELPAFMIKPVQRICKYPLLLEQLVKKTPEDASTYQELVEGLAVIKRITDKVNETQRLQENIQLVKDLEERVDDWKGHNINHFGRLLLCDIFMVAKSETEREYHVYLFEKILLCCKEVLPVSGKKNSKSNSLLKQKSASLQKKAKTTLQLKGRIFINNVLGALVNSKMNAILGTPGGQHCLAVWWRGDTEQESFSLRCKNEEQLKQWQTAIVKLIDEVANRAHQKGLNSSGGSVLMSPGGNMAGAGANGRRNTATSSHFPQTPLTDMAPVYPFSRTESQMGHHGEDQQEEVEGIREYGGDSHHSGRGTPMGGRFSAQSESDRHRSHGNEMGGGNPLTQWRSNSPAVRPPVPRHSSSSTNPPTEQSLRKASSTHHLRQAGGYPNGAAPTTGGAGGVHPNYSRALRPAGSDAKLSDRVETVEPIERISGGGPPANFRPRGDSLATMARASSDGGPQTRSRSASSPQVYPPLAASQFHPPLPSPSPLGPNQPDSYHRQQQQQNGHSSASSYAAGAQVGGDKRYSSSSISTMGSNQSYQSRPQSTAASSPNTLSGGSVSGSRAESNATPTNQQHGSSAIKLHVRYGGDVTVLVILHNIGLKELREKVTKKIKAVGGQTITESDVRLKYVDEDGDPIQITCEDDVQMALEVWKASADGAFLIVN